MSEQKKPGGITGKGFKPGQSGNPNGRPKTAKFSEACKELAADTFKKTGETNAQALARKCLERALRGKGSAKWAEMFLHYAEGKPPQSLNLTGGLVLSQEERTAKLLEKLRAIREAEA